MGQSPAEDPLSHPCNFILTEHKLRQITNLVEPYLRFYAFDRSMPNTFPMCVSAGGWGVLEIVIGLSLVAQVKSLVEFPYSMQIVPHSTSCAEEGVW